MKKSPIPALKQKDACLAIRSAAALTAAAAALFSGHSTYAASYYWDTTSGLWSTGANWSDNATIAGTTGLVPSATDSVVFNQSSVNGDETVQLTGTTGIAGITFANTGTTLLDSDSATTRALNVGTGGITINSGAGLVTLGDATNIMTIGLNGNQSWANNSSSLLTVKSAISDASASNPVTLTVNGSGSGGTTFSGAISDNGALGKTAVVVSTTGTGVTTFSAGNSFKGGFTLTSGSVKSTATLGLGDINSALNLNGGTLELAAMSGSTTSLTLKTTASNTTTIGGNTKIISNRATASSTGTDYQFGGLSIGNATLTVDKGSNVTGAAVARVSFFGALTLTGDATFDTNGGALLVLNNDSSGTNTAVKLTGNFNLTFKSSDGTGVMSLRAPNASTRSSGVTTLESGTLTVNSDTATNASGQVFGTTGTTLALNGGTFDIQLTKGITAYNTTVGGNVSIITERSSAGAGINQTLGTLSIGANTLSVTSSSTVTSGTAGLTFGATTLTGNAIFSVANGTNTGGSTTTLTLGGVSESGGSYGLTKNGATAMILSGTSNYTGATAVNAGTLRAGTTTGFSGSSAVTMANVATAILDLNSFNNSIGSLAGGGAIGGNVTLGTATLTLGGDNTSTSYAGVISGTGGLTKTGTGIQTLTNTSTYSGTTAITGGTLRLGASGSIGSSALVRISSGATFDVSATSFTLGASKTLRGAGNVTGAVTMSGTSTIAGGVDASTLGTLTFSSTLTSASGATFSLKLNSDSALSDAIIAAGITLNGATLSLSDLGTTTLSGPTVFTLFHSTSTSISGTFAGLNEGASITVGGNSYTISYAANGGNDVTLTAVAIPEPSTYAAILSVLVVAGAVCRRRSHIA